MSEDVKVPKDVLSTMIEMAMNPSPEARIAYISKTIDVDWVVSGWEFYDTLPDKFKESLAVIIPDDMPIDFYVGAAHIAESSNVGARICYIISHRSATDEFIEKLNSLVARINEGGM